MNPSSPYQAPAAPHGGEAPDDLARKLRIWKRVRLVSVVACILLPLRGIAGTALGMVRAFEELRQAGEADPSELAGHISSAMLTTFYGMLLLLPALALLVVSILRVRRLKRALAEDLRAA